MQSKLLTQYVLNLAKYDQNYDIRDRARFIRQLIVPTEKSGALNKYAKKLFLAQKPAPILESSFKGTESQHLGGAGAMGTEHLSMALGTELWKEKPVFLREQLGHRQAHMDLFWKQAMPCGGEESSLGEVAVLMITTH